MNHSVQNIFNQIKHSFTYALMKLDYDVILKFVRDTSSCSFHAWITCDRYSKLVIAQVGHDVSYTNYVCCKRKRYENRSRIAYAVEKVSLNKLRSRIRYGFVTLIIVILLFAYVDNRRDFIHVLYCLLFSFSHVRKVEIGALSLLFVEPIYQYP
jgi:hypothetical protein